MDAEVSLAGVPGIYLHNLFGSPNYHDGVAESGRSGTANRQIFLYHDLEEILSDPEAKKSRVFTSYKHDLKIHQGHSAFKPLADQKILDLDERVFSVLRTSQDGSESMLCVINVSNHPLSM